MRYMKLSLVIGGALLLVTAFPSHAMASEAKMVHPSVSIETTHKKESSFQSERSWYGSSCIFFSSYRTESHYYDGNNLGIEMTCSSPISGSFTVTLYRSSNRPCGSATFSRTGFTKATWTNVGPGTYYFVFTKTSDGTAITTSDIAMYSW